jgi:ferredoxin
VKVWIDADQCMGAGTCATIAPEVFVPRSDGIWAVRELAEDFGETTVFDGGAGPGHGPEGAAGMARVPDRLFDVVIEAAQECPGECIYLEV